MTDLILTIFGIGSVVAILAAIISNYLDETTKNELFRNDYRDSLNK